MRDTIMVWSSMALAVCALLLVGAGFALHYGNKSLRQTVEQRQQQITVGQNFAQLYQGVAQNLAAAAVERNDTEIRAFLEKEGLKLAPSSAAAETKQTRSKK